MRGRMPRQEYEVHGGSWPRCEDCEGCAADGRLPCGPGSAANNAGKMLGGGRRLSHPPSGDEVHHHLGVSGFATYAASAVVVGDDVPADVAAVLGCAVLTGGGAVLKRRQTRSGRSGHGRRSRWGRDGCADHRRSPHRDRQLLGSAVPRRDIPEYAQMWREGRLPVEHLISSRIRLTDINSAMDQLADGTVIRQVIIFDQIVFFGRVRRDGRSRRMIARRFLPGCRSRVVEMCPWGGRARRSPRGVGAAPAG